MPDNNIRNITISATGDTQRAQDSLDKLIIRLKTIKDLVGAGLSFNAKGFENIATAVKSLKDVKISKTTANNITALADAISRFRSAAIQTQTSDSVQQMAASLAALQGTRISKKVIDDLPQLGIALSFFARQFTSEDVKKIVQLSVALQYLSGVNLKGMGGLAGLLEQMRQLQEVQQSGTTSTEQETREISRLGSVASTAAAALRGLVSPRKIVSAIFSGIANGANKAAVSVGRLAVNLVLLPFKHVASRVANLTKRFTGFLAAIKRIAVYRAIRTALKEISQGFREGVENLYQYSLLINGEFAQSMDTIATASLYAKNSLGAMAAPIINVLAPAIDFLVDKFVDALNTINELIASLSGAQTWTRALKYPKAYADALDGANGKAKELRATLLGFDEINRLDDNKKGSRGSAADELDYSKMFTEEVVNSKAKGIISMLKEAFLSGAFYDIGSMLGEKLREGLSNIPWDSIKDRINKNAMSAATFINGIVDTEGLPDEIGHTIAEAFNTMVSKINTFFGNVKWDKVGDFIGDTLSKAVEDIDKQELASAIKNILGAALDVAWGMIQADPLVGTIALAAIGLRFGKLLGTNMATGVSSSGLTSTIQGLIPKVAVLAITAAVSFKIGNYLYNNVGWVQEIADNLVEWWNVFWGTEAYYATAGFYEQEKKLMDRFKAASLEWDNERKWLLEQGYSSLEAYDVLMAQEQLKTIAWQHQVNQALGLENSYIQDMFAQMKATSKLTEEEYDALVKLTIKRWEINFEIKFGKSPKEFIEEGIANIKSNLQKPIDNMKETGKELGTALKNTFLSIFDNDSLSNSIRERLKNSIPSKITIDSVNSGLVSIRAYAGGGDPSTGSLFIAGERGAELVSSTGHGTNVANQNHIAASVAEGVEYANEEQNALLREQNELLRDLLRKDFTAVAQITTGQIRNALDRDNKRAGTTLVAVN